MYDLIGDRHGHADELRALLHYLGYRPDTVGVPRYEGGRAGYFLPANPLISGRPFTMRSGSQAYCEASRLVFCQRSARKM